MNKNIHEFIFWHHEIHGPLDLNDIWSGNHGYGGSVSRLRILFWISKLGYSVKLIGNVLDGNLHGVQSISGIKVLDNIISNKNTILILNDSPTEINWKIIEKKSTIIKIYWAGVPFEDKWLKRISKGYLDRIVCVSKYHKNLYKIYSTFNKIEYAYSGIDLDILDNASATKLENNTILFISVPRKTKGFHILLEAWKLILKEVPDAKLRVCGSALMHDPNVIAGKTGVLDIDIENEFPLFFDNLPNSLFTNRIEFMGVRDLNEVYADMKGSTLAIVNANFENSYETYCRSAIEAQAAGIAIVAPNRGSLTEVIKHNLTGILVDSNNSNDFAKQIIFLLKNTNIRENMGANGRNWIKPIANLEVLAKEWVYIAERAINNKKAPTINKDLYDFFRFFHLGEIKLFLKSFDIIIIKNILYELIMSIYFFKKGRTRLLNFVTKNLNIKPYGYYKLKKVGDYNLRLDPGDQNDLHYFFDWTGKSYQFILSKLIKKGDIIFDVGVNVGFFSVYAANKISNTGKIYSIEASPIMVKRFENVLHESKLDTISIYNNALWKETCDLEFNVATNSGWSSIIENPTFTIENKYIVQAITLDEFCLKHKIKHIDFLKLDIEGAEMDALLGSIKMLSERSIDMILLEVEPYRLEAFKHTGLEIYDFLSNLGYTAFCSILNDKIFKITDKNRIPGKDNSDYLFVRNELYNEKYNLLWK